MVNMKYLKKYAIFVNITILLIFLVYIKFLTKMDIKTLSITTFNFVLLYLTAKKTKSNIFGKTIVTTTILLLGGLIYVFHY